jgi:hypothetical protein
MTGRWGWPEGGAAGAGARHRGDDDDLYGHLVDASLWQAARLIGGITGASELPEEPIRTENESARNAKNPQ